MIYIAGFKGAASRHEGNGREGGLGEGEEWRKGKRGSGKGGERGKSGGSALTCLLMGAYTPLPAVIAVTEQWARGGEGG